MTDPNRAPLASMTATGHRGEAGPPRARSRGGLWLLIGAGVMGLTWGVVLPRAARVAAIDNWIREQEQQGVDPAAMYYSDLEGVRFLDLGWRPAWRVSRDRDAAPVESPH